MDATATATATLATIEHFNEVFNTGDVDAIMALFSDDCVFENTQPPPDGGRFEGRAAVRGFWEKFFAGTRKPHFKTERIFAADDLCASQWTFTWENADGSTGHVRGVDIFRVTDGKVAEKLSYVKG